jgi:DNA-binding CsgD family transcriptional regulator
VIMTCPVMHKDIRYITRNSSTVLGYEAEELIFYSNVDRYFSMVYEADREDLITCYAYIHDFITTVPPELHSRYRIVYHYRFQKKDGSYIYLHDEKAVLHLQDSGNLYYTLFRDVSGETIFTGVKVEIFLQDSSLVKIADFKPLSNRQSLTKRENELVTLIRRGLSTKEIAGQLNISHNTVRNIKSKLFEKYNVSNTVELLNMTA